MATIPGSEIPSGHVDPSRQYLVERRISALDSAGAFFDDPAERSVALRADGIIENLPVNDRLTVAELVVLENPPFYDSLEVPELWLPEFDVTDDSVPPGPLHVAASLGISTLPPALKNVANRLQLLFDGDDDPSTVMLADVYACIDLEVVFTPAEIAQLYLIDTELRAVRSVQQRPHQLEVRHRRLLANDQAQRARLVTAPRVCGRGRHVPVPNNVTALASPFRRSRLGGDRKLSKPGRPAVV